VSVVRTLDLEPGWALATHWDSGRPASHPWAGAGFPFQSAHPKRAEPTVFPKWDSDSFLEQDNDRRREQRIDELERKTEELEREIEVERWKDFWDRTK
jgi:hypothetical protein